MNRIIRVGSRDFDVVQGLAKETFIESHGHSAPETAIAEYLNRTFNETLEEELQDPDNLYYVIYDGHQPAGYSKTVLHAPHPNILWENVSKLERLYLLQAFHGLKLGFELLKHNIEISKADNEKAMWLFVWKENKRAINFYSKNGFKIIGTHDFKISENHVNPNHQMLMEY